MLIKTASNDKLKFAANSNEHAFTLLEVLIAFSFFTIIVFFITPIFQLTLQNNNFKASIQPLEWQVFCNQINKEIKVSSKADVLSGKLVLTKETETILYEKYGTNIRRRVNSTGHEIVLQNVAQLSFTKFTSSVKLTVIDSWGKAYSFTFHPILHWNS